VRCSTSGLEKRTEHINISSQTTSIFFFSGSLVWIRLQDALLLPKARAQSSVYTNYPCAFHVLLLSHCMNWKERTSSRSSQKCLLISTTIFWHPLHEVLWQCSFTSCDCGVARWNMCWCLAESVRFLNHMVQFCFSCGYAYVKRVTSENSTRQISVFVLMFLLMFMFIVQLFSFVLMLVLLL